MKAIFVPQWAVRSEQDCDEMLSWCRDAGITDVFYQTGVKNRDTINGIYGDYIQYITQHRGELNIHAHITTLVLWRDKNYLTQEERPEILDEWLWLNNIAVEPRWILSAIHPDVQDYLINKCTEVVRNYDVQGIYLERLYYHPAFMGPGTQEEKKQALTTILQRVATECRAIKDVKISVATWLFDEGIIERMKKPKVQVDYERLQDIPVWETIVDYLMPFIFRDGTDFDTLIGKVKGKHNYVPTLGCFRHNLDETVRQYKKSDNVSFYAYHKMSNPNVPMTEVKEAICPPTT